MRDRFGSTITIERRINKSGGNPYKLLSHNGRTMSTKKEDVDAVLDKFVIDAGNPLTVITQDMARSFLAGALWLKLLWQLWRVGFQTHMLGAPLRCTSACCRVGAVSCGCSAFVFKQRAACC